MTLGRCTLSILCSRGTPPKQQRARELLGRERHWRQHLQAREVRLIKDSGIRIGKRNMGASFLTATRFRAFQVIVRQAAACRATARSRATVATGSAGRVGTAVSGLGGEGWVVGSFT